MILVYNTQIFDTYMLHMIYLMHCMDVNFTTYIIKERVQAGPNFKNKRKDISHVYQIKKYEKYVGMTIIQSITS